ncbi:MAG: sugar phosphate isomerase/epimerase family protein [Phycisphaerales bacterium]
MMPISISMAGLAGGVGLPWCEGGVVDARRTFAWAASIGARAVQIDAALVGVRPRQLDRSARREVAALMRRAELAVSGLDLWIPPAHFGDGVKAGRAVEAVVAAMELATELTGLVGGGTRGVVSVELPESGEVRAELSRRAQELGALLADHGTMAASGGAAEGPIGVGIDPATVMASGGDPVTVAARAGTRLMSARLSTWASGQRVSPTFPGQGLDIAAYVAAAHVAGYRGAMVADLRGVAKQAEAARAWIARL